MRMGPQKPPATFWQPLKLFAYSQLTSLVRRATLKENERTPKSEKVHNFKVRLRDLLSAVATPKHWFNVIMCGQRASHASLVGDGRRRGEWKRGDDKQGCLGLSSEPLSKGNLLGGLWTAAVIFEHQMERLGRWRGETEEECFPIWLRLLLWLVNGMESSRWNISFKAFKLLMLTDLFLLLCLLGLLNVAFQHLRWADSSCVQSPQLKDGVQFDWLYNKESVNNIWSLKQVFNFKSKLSNERALLLPLSDITFIYIMYVFKERHDNVCIRDKLS